MKSKDRRYRLIMERCAFEVKLQRNSRGLTQIAFAAMLGTSQSRVSNIERADPSVRFDLMLRALLCLDVTVESIGCTIAG